MATKPMVRTASAEGSLQLSQPTPDLQSPTDGFATHVERLEHHAERMSSSGSDIGEEIRRLKSQEDSKSHSRRSSLLSAAPADNDNTKPLPAGRSRNASISSYTNSIVETNSAARWGGYSPSAYVTSPKGSIRSGSWSHRSIQRQQSASRRSTLGQFPESTDNADEADTATVHNEPQSRVDAAQVQARHTSQFSLEYDQIVQDLENELANVPSQESAPAAGAYDHVAYSMMFDPDELPDRPATADTYQQAQTAFHDFDGVHCNPALSGLREISEGSEHSMLHSLPHSQPQGVPPPNDGMVFYPAPVPRMLNLPKRLSQLPSTDVRMKRRTQVLDSISAEARNSALWLGGDRKTDKRKSVNPRQSVAMDKLPPQLRASMYFDQPSVPHEVDIKGESAQATLDDILNASAQAPVGAFTDHPMAGPVGKTVYGKENKRKSTSTMLDKRKSSASLLDMDRRKSTATVLEPEKEKKEKRKSSFGFLLGRRSSTDELKKLQKKNSSGDKINKLQKRNSQMSLGKAMEQSEANNGRPGTSSSHNSHVDESTPLHEQENPIDAYTGLPLSRDEDESEGEDEGQIDDEPQFFGPPTTLLAELQMRKAQQRERNRTAATAFPNGMHSTLLELDAVAEIEKRRRQNQRVNLAWQSGEHEEEDEDVPLGMLFPGQNGLAARAGKGVGAGRGEDWDRPLGLLEKKELEDNEPLSRRRNRLRGLAPDAPYQREPSPGQRMTMYSQEAPRISAERSPDAQQAQKHESEDEDEPLAARRERLKRKELLDSALGRPISGDFASEMMSQFGALDGDEKKDSENKGTTPKTPGNEEEETLGQRRARLQAEAAARGATTPSGLSPGNPLRPPLKASRSLADILSAHPAGNQANKINNDALLSSLPQGSLLLKNEQKKARLTAEIRDGNKRSSSHQLDGPLLDVGAPQDGRTKSMILENTSGERGLLGKETGTGLAGIRQSSGSRPNLNKRMSTMTLGTSNMMGGNIAGGNMMGAGMPTTPMSMPAMNGSGFLNPQAGMMGMGMPMQQPQPMMMAPMQVPMATPMNMNMGMGMGMGMGGMGMGGMGMNGFPGGQMMMGQPYGVQPFGGMQMGMGGMGGMGAQAQMPMDMSLDPGRRAAIDRWRQDIS